jgi:hypothetical protein
MRLLSFGKDLDALFEVSASIRQVKGTCFQMYLATAIGLHYLSRVGADETEQMVKKTVNYLLHTFDKQKKINTKFQLL